MSDIICNNLISLRQMRNLGIDVCAQVAGVSKEEYEKVEQGAEKPSSSMLIKLTEFYGLDDLLFFVKEHNFSSQAESKEIL